jgi:hypothetical protein
MHASAAAPPEPIRVWRNAGWYGRDRFLLPKLGTPWHRGVLFTELPDMRT